MKKLYDLNEPHYQNVSEEEKLCWLPANDVPSWTADRWEKVYEILAWISAQDKPEPKVISLSISTKGSHMFLNSAWYSLPPVMVACSRRRSCCRLRGCGTCVQQVGGGDVEDRADAQKEATEDGAQFRDEIELHHLAQVRIVTWGVRSELGNKGALIMK